MGIKKRLEHLLKHNKYVQATYRYTMSGAFKFLGVFVKTDEKMVLMNGHGFRYNDSPRAIFEKMSELGMLEEYHVVWALNEPEKYDIPNADKIKITHNKPTLILSINTKIIYVFKMKVISSIYCITHISHTSSMPSIQIYSIFLFKVQGPFYIYARNPIF